MRIQVCLTNRNSFKQKIGTHYFCLDDVIELFEKVKP